MKNISLLFVTAMTLGLVSPAEAGTHTWVGTTTNGLWTTPANWQSSSAPVLNESPLHLIFPSGAARKTMTNNFNGLPVDTMTFQGSDWNVFGAGANAALTLRNPLSISNIGVTAGSATFHLSVPFVFGGDNTFSVATNASLVLSNAMSGTGGFSKVGVGELVMNGLGDNTYTGATYVNAGTLSLRRTFVFGPYIAIPGPLIVGSYQMQTNAALRPTVQFLSNEQIATNAPVFVFPSGRLLLQDRVQTLGSLTINSGEFDTGTNGLLKLIGSITSTNILIGNTQLIGELKGNIDLGDAPRSIRVEALPLNLRARISGNTNGTLEKFGQHSLRLLGTNTYLGRTVIREGVIEAMRPLALGSNSAPTIVSNGAALWLEGGITINEPFVLNGYSSFLITNYGALCSFGSNACFGTITLGSDAFISTPGISDFLTIGHMTGTGGWEKRGAGTARIYGSILPANSYQGITRIHQGTLVLDKTGDSLAVPGALEIGLPAGGGPARCEVMREGELEVTAAITLGAQGTLALKNGYVFAGSIAGNGTIDISPTAKLFTGFNNANSTFNGTLTGGEPTQPHFFKYGTGLFDFGGVNQLASRIWVQEGGLRINSAQPTAEIEVASAAELGGTGSVSSILAHAYSVVAPGANIGKLRTGSFTNDGIHLLNIDLNGPLPGTGYDQFEVDATPKLFRISLKINVVGNFNPTNGQKFIILKNNGSAFTDTFNYLNEGDLIQTASGHVFEISFHGGDGNDVELTARGGVTKIQGIQITPSAVVVTASGIPGAEYRVEFSLDLNNEEGWTLLDFIVAEPDGSLVFEDFDKAIFPQCYYRFVLAE